MKAYFHASLGEEHIAKWAEYHNHSYDLIINHIYAKDGEAKVAVDNIPTPSIR